MTQSQENSPEQDQVYSYFTDVVEALCCHWLENQLLAADTHKGLFQFLQKILEYGKGIKKKNSITVLTNATYYTEMINFQKFLSMTAALQK